ncbi:hypothetical protein MKX01_002980 [Papaver californicum]|nr:hypothetical protein MKX01_002980 [Papaver californicum]
MVWVMMNRRSRLRTSMRKKIVVICSLFLLVLIRLQYLETSSSSYRVEATSRMLLFANNDNSRSGSSSQEDQDHHFNTIDDKSKNEFQFNGSNYNNTDQNGDSNLFDADKRRIHTGPNPLHNKR